MRSRKEHVGMGDPRRDKPSIALLMKQQHKIDLQHDDIADQLHAVQSRLDTLRDEEATLQAKQELLVAEANEIQDAINVLMVGRKKRQS